jgi:hypothetical protein
MESIFSEFNDNFNLYNYDSYKKITDYKPLGSEWTDEEIKRLIKLYKSKHDIISISNTLNRFPGSVISKLHKLEIIWNRTHARGYKSYINSKYYREILAISSKKWNECCKCGSLNH